MRFISSLAFFILVLAANTNATNQGGDKFYERRPYEGKNGDIAYIEKFTYAVTNNNGKDSIDTINPSRISFKSYDTEGKIDSSHIKNFYYDMLDSEEITKMYYEDENTTRILTTIRYGDIESTTETYSRWIDSTTQKAEEREVETGKIVSSSTIHYDFENKTLTSAISIYREFEEDEKMESVVTYNNYLQKKVEVKDSKYLTSMNIEYERYEVSDIMTIREFLATGEKKTISTLYKNTKYDEHNNRIEWKEYADHTLTKI